ncbi:A24 family peptidase, partial [Akkermansiaceae bacterium]|nr:A24 family peptidase [Akkermansiaceae bacterium]
SWTTAGSVIALGGSLLVPQLLDLPELESDWIRESSWAGLRVSAIGWVVGFGSLWGVVLLGKLIFGRLRLNFKEAALWRLQEGYEDDEQLYFVIGKEPHSWDELFYRPTDRLVIQGHGFKVDGKRRPAKELRIGRDDLEIGGETWKITDLKSLEGKATNVIIPREAMGMGDPHLLGMIGAFLGWPAVVFVIFMSCISAIMAALVARVGFGKPLPYGPFLAFGALVWIFGGFRGWIWYFELVQGGFSP